MRLVRSVIFLSTLVAMGSAAPPAASPGDSLVVSTTWLAQHLNDQNLVLLHLGSKAEYDAKHIPGARYVRPELDVPADGLSLVMLPPNVIHDRLTAIGISDDSRVVIYYGKDYGDIVSPATRLLFTLDYAGLGRATSLLDGGQIAWTRDGHQVTSDVPPTRIGTLSPLKMRPIVVDGDYVLKHLKTPHFAIVDARASSFYEGLQTGGRKDSPLRSGHIAGAFSVPFNAITDDQLILRSPEDLAAMFTKAGVKPDDTVIGYCHVGQQATAMLFAARTLGHPVLLYDGSFKDWSQHPEYPVENPAVKRR
jgi:thiosulfate/3-mercaptopyruvate sulfurtransferase